jgi:hypothetical protein
MGSQLKSGQKIIGATFFEGWTLQGWIELYFERLDWKSTSTYTGIEQPFFWISSVQNIYFSIISLKLLQ